MKPDGVTHWSIPVNNLAESERFYDKILGLVPKGRLGNSKMSAFTVGDNNWILLCERNDPITRTKEQDNRLHHSFTVSPEMFVQACKLFKKENVKIDELIYREHGFFTGRELYFFDPSNNLLEVRDPTWKPGMPTQSYDEIVSS
jgi:catechol 2,3-dioxygenase-like lactoylglutathione lyase family enzyme